MELIIDGDDSSDEETGKATKVVKTEQSKKVLQAKGAGTRLSGVNVKDPVTTVAMMRQDVDVDDDD